jgi:diguanylate cyclase (GGDEF)-like protein
MKTRARAGSGRRPLQRGDAQGAILAEQLRLLKLAPSDVLAQIVGALAVIGCLWPLFPAWAFALWFAVLVTSLIVRREIQRRYRAGPIDPEAAGRWGRWMMAWAFVTGCAWGLVSSAFVVTNEVVYQVLAFAAVGGMTITGVIKNAASVRVMIAFVAPVLAMPIAMLLVRPDVAHLCIAAMVTVFSLVMGTAGRSLNRSILADVRVRLELVDTGAALANTQAIAGVGSWEVDLATGAVGWSQEMGRILGLGAASQARGPPAAPSLGAILDRVHPEDRDKVAAAIAAWVEGDADLALEHRLASAEGPARWIHHVGLTQNDAAGRPLRRMAVVQDVTDKKRAEADIQFANVLMKTQMEASEDGVLVVDNRRRIISFNQRFADIFDCPEELLESGRYDAVLRHVLAQAKDPVPVGNAIEFFYDNPGLDGREEFALADGRFFNRYTASLTGPGGDYLGRAWFYRDVTDQKRALVRALETARTDQLTGLANRGAFVERLRAAIAGAGRRGPGFAVLYIDLDHFKDVNDTLGHPAGDQLLRAVADRLRAATRPSDTVARFGGDEFAVIAAEGPGGLGDDGGDDAARVAATLIRVISEPYVLAGAPVHVGASVGIARYGPGAVDAETMLAQADMALYNAKSEGRSGFRCFNTGLERAVRTRVSLRQELHGALEDDQLFLVYQPQVHLGSLRVVGVEALVRWRHPTRGVLAPGLFVPIAEQTGEIGQLGHWVLATACRQARAWLDAGAPPTRVGVNVSAVQLKSAATFECEVEAALAESRLPPHCLELELTETVLMTAEREQKQLLQRLRARGVTLAIDDFGTGYASLDYLRRFPISRIKIAPDFTRDLDSPAATSDAAIVKATIGLARDLGIEVIAEGVERPGQIELLQKWGCSELQGFYICEPLAADEVPALLSAPVPTRAPSETRRVSGDSERRLRTA